MLFRSSNYFHMDGVRIEDYIENVCHGIDPRKDERMRCVRASIANTDGTCGEKVLEQIIEKMEKQ